VFFEEWGRGEIKINVTNAIVYDKNKTKRKTNKQTNPKQ
jgi:hypothetical protein